MNISTVVLRRIFAVMVVVAPLAGCGAVTSLGHVVQPPRFEPAPGQLPEIRLVAHSPDQPAGAARIRLWAKVTNPNGFSFTLREVRTTLVLEEELAATADVPLGLAMAGGRESIVPLDLTVSFAGLPHLRSAVRRAANGLPVAYRLDGTIGVEAGHLGAPTFGPMTLMSGELLTQ